MQGKLIAADTLNGRVFELFALLRHKRNKGIICCCFRKKFYPCNIY